MCGMDHLDEWYRDSRLVAVAHYPYGMDSDALRQAVAGCAELGLHLDIDTRYAIHAADEFTLAVVISASGLYDVLRGSGRAGQM